MNTECLLQLKSKRLSEGISERLAIFMHFQNLILPKDILFPKGLARFFIHKVHFRIRVFEAS